MKFFVPIQAFVWPLATAAVIGRVADDCKVLPGDPAWPSADAWNSFNQTIDGKLIATVPLGSICHPGGFAGSSYDAAACETLRSEWDLPAAYNRATADPMQPYFQNTSCSPFYEVDKPCTLGNYAVYSVAVTSPEDVVAGMKFAEEHNIRLVVRNTGHDFLGKSTGQGSLALLMRGLKTNELISEYSGSSNYTGPAVKLGAGTTGGEAALLVSAAGYRMVTGDCPTVGVAAGYSMGGGHGLLNSVNGLASDNVLEWEVVTATGEHLVATETQNQDLYWALSGGGGGTYAVVLSMTARIFQDGQVGAATLRFNRTASPSTEVYTEALSLWWQALPPIVDAGVTALYQISDGEFWLQNATAPGQTAEQIKALLDPYLEQLTELDIPFEVESWTAPTYSQHYSDTNGPLPEGIYPTTMLFNSRLIPRAVSETAERSKNLSLAMEEAIASDPSAGFFFGCSALNVWDKPHPDNSVVSYWREAIAVCINIAIYDWELPQAEMLARRVHMADVITPLIEAQTQDSGAYLNEIDPLVYPQGNLMWQKDFYGSNYERLLNIKKKWDPNSLLYAPTAVGSDEWMQDDSGRLCKASP